MWIFIVLLSLFIIRNFRGTCCRNAEGKDLRGQKKVGNPCDRQWKREDSTGMKQYENTKYWHACDSLL